MEKYYIATGKTIDLAIQAGLSALGMDRDSVSVEVLENARTGFLGIGASPAKVKVTYEVPDEAKPATALSSASRSKPKKKEEAATQAAPKIVDLPKAASKPQPKVMPPKPEKPKAAEPKPQPNKEPKPQAKALEKPKPAAQKPQPKAPESAAEQQPSENQNRSRRSNDRRRPNKPKAEHPTNAPKADAPKADAPKVDAPKLDAPKAAPKSTLPPYTPPAPDSTEARIEQFILGLLQHMGSTAVPQAIKTDDDIYHVELVGESLGMLIGRRGETLDAIQHLTNYAINRDSNKRSRINVDAESYRAKREESLQHLAQKVAGKVTRYHRNITLEPMNAYERHIIHTALQDVPEITTFSTGTEPNRRVVVAFSRYKENASRAQQQAQAE